MASAWWLLICLMVASITVHETATLLEDHMETQNDPRLPTSFRSYNYMVGRAQGGFTSYEVHSPDGTNHTTPVVNWELWTHGYWYEYREVGMECPWVPDGISATCDWALMIPCLFGNMSKAPKTIYVHQLMLPHFYESTLRFMDPSYKFVLVSGGTDQTMPLNTGDVRYRNHGLRGFGGEGGGEYWHGIAESPQVLHWYSENHDLTHPKVSTLPTGLATGSPDSSPIKDADSLPLRNRTMKVLSMDRTRDRQGQWAKRGQVADWCRASPSFCYKPDDSADGSGHNDFVGNLTAHMFIACVQGGGIDPSPKAWEALMAGTIPIIESSTVSDGYEEFPVVILNKWEDLFLAENPQALLKKWYKKLAPFYEPHSVLRAQVLEKLRTSYWVRKFHKTYYLAMHNMTEALSRVTGKNRAAVVNDDLWADGLWAR